MDTENLKENGPSEDLSFRRKSHRHDFSQVGNYLICKCGKKILSLEHTGKENLRIGKKDNGRGYSVRLSRKRYFFPDEWTNFIKQFKNKTHRFFFLTCLHTGGRIMEVLNLRYRDIDETRETVTFSIVKQRKAKKNFYATGKTRGFFVSSEFISEYKSLIRGKTINKEHYIFLDNENLPKNYSELDNEERKKYYVSKVVSYSNMLKRKLRNAGIKDYYNFSPHNIRKTYGMWMRTFNKEMAEICYRMGHDVNTFIAHYGSSLIFTEDERRKISSIFGDVK
jgi:integrase